MALEADQEKKAFSTSDFGWAVGVFAVALAIRVVYLAGWIQSPYYDVPLLDEQYHHDWALRIVEGAETDTKPFFRAPLYIYCVAGVYKTFGDGPIPIRMAQALVGSLSALLLFFLGRMLFGRTAGGIAGLIMALYPPLIFFDGELLIPVALVFLDLVFVIALVRAWDTDRQWRWAGAGFAGGISAIARPNILLPVAVLGLWAILNRRKPGQRRQAVAVALAFGLGALAAIAPVTIRNRAVGGDWVLVASQGGIVAYAGNGPEADGYTPRHARLYSRFERYEDTFELYAIHGAEEAMGRELRPSEVSRYWGRRTAAYVAQEPVRFLKLMLKKTVGFWTRTEIRNNKNIGFALQWSPPVAQLHRVLHFGLIGPLALLGLIWALARIRTAAPVVVFVFIYAASVIIFFVCERYRAPMHPYFILFGVWAGGQIVKIYQSKEFHRLRGPVLGLVASALFVNIEWFGEPPEQNLAEDYWMVSVCHQKKGDFEAERAALEQALAEDPEHFSSLHNLGNIELISGDPDKALQLYNRAIEAFPGFATAYNSAAAILLKQGKTAQARELLEQCLEIDPYHALARVNYGSLLLAEGELDKAEEQFNRAIELFPSHYGAYAGMAKIAAQHNDASAEKTWTDKAIEIGGQGAKAAIEKETGNEKSKTDN